MPLKKQVSPYKYKCDDLFKTLAQYQCIKLLQTVASSYKIPDDIVAKERENIIKQINNLQVNISYKKRKEYTKNNITSDDLNNRCCGRVYSANNLISIDETTDKLIYGSRCARKITSPNSSYCKQHNMSLTHGNFLEEPDKYIKNHFIIDYIKQVNKNDKVMDPSKSDLVKRVLIIKETI
jgi:hypothetical protein